CDKKLAIRDETEVAGPQTMLVSAVDCGGKGPFALLLVAPVPEPDIGAVDPDLSHFAVPRWNPEFRMGDDNSLSAAWAPATHDSPGRTGRVFRLQRGSRFFLYSAPA